VEEVRTINPFLFVVLTALVTEGQTYATMDYVKVIMGGVIAGIAVYRIGDIKMILYVIVIGVIVVAAILLIPNLAGSPIQTMLLEALNELPSLLQQLLGGGSVI